MNDTDTISAFLGPDLYPRFKKYTQDLLGKEVRGRTPGMIVDDAKHRRNLWDEVGNELKALPPAPMKDPAQVERTIKHYLEQKL